MAARLRHHVNPLKLAFAAGIRAAPIPLSPGQPVEVELGCAEAQWLFERARNGAASPWSWIGVEIREELVVRVNREAQRLAIGDRVRAIYANLSTDLRSLFGASTVDRFVLNFPDPWFKSRHHKRRLLDSDLASELVRQLKPGGELFFQSDVWEVALAAMEILEQVNPGLTNTAGPWTFLRTNPYGVRSRREERSIERGQPIWRLLYRKDEPTLSPDPAPRAP